MIITWFCLVCLSLHGTNSRTEEPVKRFYGVSGGEISFRCSFPSSAEWKIFCWENCEEENNILITTRETSARRRRYRIESVRNNQYVFDVIISALIGSDSGWYQCGLWTHSYRYLYWNFELLVAEALLDGSASISPRLHKDAGSSLTVACSFGSDGRKLQFCRGECRKQVLVETDGVRAERGRYSIEYEGGLLYVSISALIGSDSGRYRCNLDVAGWRDPYRDFDLTVTDAVQPSTTTTTTTTATTTTAATTGSSSSSAANFTSTTTRSFSSSASSFTSSGSAASDRSALADGNKSPPDALLTVGLALAFIFIIIMLAVALLVFCRNRSQNPAAPAVKTQKTPAVETNEVYEEIRGDEMKSVPVRISAVYSCASFCQPADGVYSLAMAALPLDTAEDDLTRPTYAQVNFLNRSSDSQLRPSNDVVYSVPRVAVGSHVGGESLYSNTA